MKYKMIVLFYSLEGTWGEEFLAGNNFWESSPIFVKKQMESVSITYFSGKESLGWLSAKMPQWGNTLILVFTVYVTSIH